MTTTHTQPAGCDLDSLRAAFEADASDNGKWPRAVERNPDTGSYVLAQTHSAWMNWQRAAEALACAAQAPQGDTRQGAHTCTPADERAMPQRWQDRLPKGAGLSYDYAHVSAMKQEIEEWRARAAQGAGTAPVGMRQVGWFAREGAAWFPTSSDDPRAEIFYCVDPAPVSTAAAPNSNSTK